MNKNTNDKIYGETYSFLPDNHPFIEWIYKPYDSPAECILALSEILIKTYDIQLLVEKNPHPARFYISYTIEGLTIYRIYNFISFGKFTMLQSRYKTLILRAVQDLLFRAVYKIYNNNGEIYKSRYKRRLTSFELARRIDQLHRIFNKRLTSTQD